MDRIKNDMNFALKEFFEGRLSQDKYCVSMVSVIAPIPYDMGKGEVFPPDFAISYWTTYEKQKMDIIRGCKEHISSEFSTGFPIVLDIDSRSQYLKDLAKARIKNNGHIYYKIWDAYLDLICLTASIQGKAIYFNDFVQSFNKKFRMEKYWYSIGTINNSDKEVVERTNRVLDLAHDGKGNKCSIPMLSGIKV